MGYRVSGLETLYLPTLHKIGLDFSDFTQPEQIETRKNKPDRPEITHEPELTQAKRIRVCLGLFFFLKKTL